MGPADDGQPVEELTGTPSSYAVPVVTVVLVVLAAVVALLLAARPAPHHRAVVPRPQPVPQPVPTVAATESAAANVGSVLTDALARCTRTDHHARVDVAMSLTNLTNVPLRIVSAAPASSGLQVTKLHLGAAPCGAARSRAAEKLQPGHDVVIAMRFAVATPCPGYGDVVATLTIDAGGRAVHAVTPTLANLQSLGFAGC